MTIKNEAFLAIEKSLSGKLHKELRKSYVVLSTRIAKAVGNGDYAKAYDLVDTLKLESRVTRMKSFIRLMGVQALVYGARDFSKARDSVFSTEGLPKELETATEFFLNSVAQNMTENMKTKLRQLIAKEENANAVTKSATKTFTKDFVSNVDKFGRNSIDIASSLHTSRLANWGFTVEAEFRGATSYRVSEVLDGRTCPVCREMDNKVFPVQSTKSFLEQSLSVTDPNDLKSVARFPSQTKQGILDLRKKNISELIQDGIMTPPFHPMCRGVLRKTSIVSPAFIDNNTTGHNLNTSPAKSNDLFKALEGLSGDVHRHTKGFEDKILTLIARENGFDGKPTQVSPEELQKLIDNGTLHAVMRGVDVKKASTDFKDGEFHAGQGVFGNGIYVADDLSKKSRDLVAAHAGKDGVVDTFGIKPDARIGDFKQLETERLTELALRKDKLLDDALDQDLSDEEILRLEHQIDYIFGDTGRFAASKGIDVIKVAGQGEMVILNRTAVVVGI